MADKQTIRIAVTDIGPHAEKMTSAVLAFVDDLYDIEITTDFDADFVFHSCLGYDVLKYTGVRIYITEETSPPTSTSAITPSTLIRMHFRTGTSGYP